MAAFVAPIPSVQLTDLTFLQDNAPMENLMRLANAKLSAAPRTSCMTRSVYKKVPYFKPSLETIQEKTISGMIGIAVFGVAARVLANTGFCVTTNPQWFDNFFSNSSTCLGTTIENMTKSGSLLTLFFQTSVIGLCGIGTYFAARVCLHDYRESSRLQMLSKEYSAIAESLVQGFENVQKEKKPETIKEIKGIASRLKANLPIIETNLKNVCRLPPEDVARFTSQLSLAANRVLHPEGVR